MAGKGRSIQARCIDKGGGEGGEGERKGRCWEGEMHLQGCGCAGKVICGELHAR